jgi:hypothetical protein
VLLLMVLVLVLQEQLGSQCWERFLQHQWCLLAGLLRLLSGLGQCLQGLLAY